MPAGALVVALGGAVGAASRDLLAGAIHLVAPATFPYGTFIVNVIGCLAFGLIAVTEGLVTLERAKMILYRGPAS